MSEAAWELFLGFMKGVGSGAGQLLVMNYKSILEKIQAMLASGKSKKEIEDELGDLILPNGAVNKEFLKEWGLDDEF